VLRAAQELHGLLDNSSRHATGSLHTLPLSRGATPS
jgi:hypothetical protein